MAAIYPDGRSFMSQASRLEMLTAKLEARAASHVALFNLLGIALLMIIYLPVLPADFLSIDDSLLVDLPVFTLPLSWNTFTTVFTVGAHVDYFPVRDLSYLFDWKLLGGGPMPFHITNLFFFTGAVFLFQRVLRGLGVSQGRALLASWLWCFLPQHLELVSWISARKDILGLFFTLSASAVFLSARNVGWRRFVVAQALFVCGIFSKPVYLFLPFLGVAWYWRDKTTRLLFLMSAGCSLGCAVFFRWFYSTVNPIDLATEFPARLLLVSAAVGRVILGWVFAGLNVQEIDGFGAQGAIFPLVALCAATGVLALLAYGFFSGKKAYWALGLGIVVLLGTVPNVGSPHRFFYSTRYLEPICVITFLGLGKLAPKHFGTVALIGILVGLFQTYSDEKNWESPAEVTHKAYASRPESVGTATRYLVDLKNLDRAGRISDAEREQLSALQRQLLARCWPVPATRERQVECNMFYEINLSIALREPDQPEVARWSDALAISGANFPGYEEKLATERALREGNRPAVQRWNRRWLPTPAQRILQWSAVCLRGEKVEDLHYISRKLLTPEMLESFCAADGHVHASLRPALKACLQATLAEK